MGPEKPYPYQKFKKCICNHFLSKITLSKLQSKLLRVIMIWKKESLESIIEWINASPFPLPPFGKCTFSQLKKGDLKNKYFHANLKFFGFW